MQDLLLGIDCGGTGAKVALFDATGAMLGLAERRIAMLAPAPGHTERDAEAMWQAAAGAIRDVLAETGAAPGRIAAVAATGHGNGLYLVDAAGDPVRPGINSTDTRANALVQAMREAGSLPAIRARSLKNLWPGQPEMLLRWLAWHEPDRLARAHHALFCKDFIRLRLTGKAGIETTDVSSTNLCDVRSGVLHPELLAQFGLGDLAHLFGEPVTSETITGGVSAAAAAATGLLKGTPVAAGCIDIVASALGSGCASAERVAVIAGTWSINEYVADVPVVSDDLFMVSRFAGRDRFLIVEASACSAGNLEWFLDNLIGGPAVDRCALISECNHLAASVPPKEDGLLFLPYLYGSRDSGAARGVLAGMTGFHTRAHVVRAVYEGVAFEHRAHLERLLAHRTPPETLRLSGGASRSEVWTRIFADAIGLPVETTACPATGALGAATCGAVGVGLFPDFASAAQCMVSVEQRLEPNWEMRGVYDARYRRHRHLAAATRSLWQ